MGHNDPTHKHHMLKLNESPLPRLPFFFVVLEVEHLRVELDKKWGSGRQRGRKNRPSRYRKGISGHNEVQ